MVGTNKIITFLLSFIPGVGHLYLGLNKRGLQFLIGGFACISLIPPFPMVFPFVLAVIWFYGLFDALQKATLLHQYRLDADQIQTLYKENAIPPLWIGIGSIMLGIVVLSRILFPKVWSWLLQEQNSSILLALVIIGFGIWQVSKHVGKK
ncbi:hypothetical protein HQN90_31575 [Paenibacillus alba]|uniref:hypothetical protein n=1 Tax=Paenibacillus alba TaxID=1197127 RepID=UPI0015633299|nr:hypothetical protein [Paenibacillus alba]NQX70685.1 hypothetical protein [Paenibacillus alba]